MILRAQHGDSRDRLDDRLSPNPDIVARLSADEQRLIPDDRQRVDWIVNEARPCHGHAGFALEVGVSGSVIGTRLKARFPEIALTQWTQTEWDIRDTPPGLRAFHTIYCCEVFEHLFPGETEVALQHLWGLLVEEGSLVVTVPKRVVADTVDPWRQRWEWPSHRQYFWPGTLLALLRRFFRHVRMDDRHPASAIWELAVCLK